MLPRILSLLLLAFCVNAQASQYPIEVVEFIDNIRVAAFINEEDIDKSMTWIPFEGSPPLAIGDALGAIKARVADDPEYATMKLTEIELKQIPHHQTYWHYLVRIKTELDGKSRSHYFIVLMNGKVIQGIKEPSSVK